MSESTTLIVQCAWCGRSLGIKPGQGETGVTSGMCDECLEAIGTEPQETLEVAP